MVRVYQPNESAIQPKLPRTAATATANATAVMAAYFFIDGLLIDGRVGMVRLRT